MIGLRGLMIATALALPGMAYADEPCAGARFGESVLAQFPNAMTACTNLKNIDGVIYAQYTAEVESKDEGSLTVLFKDKDGKGVARVVFAPSEDAKIDVEGTMTSVSKLEKGQTVHLYIPFDKWGLYGGDPGGIQLPIVSVSHDV
jgi:hypothetical protein